MAKESPDILDRLSVENKETLELNRELRNKERKEKEEKDKERKRASETRIEDSHNFHRTKKQRMEDATNATASTFNNSAATNMSEENGDFHPRDNDPQKANSQHPAVPATVSTAIAPSSASVSGSTSVKIRQLDSDAVIQSPTPTQVNTSSTSGDSNTSVPESLRQANPTAITASQQPADNTNNNTLSQPHLGTTVPSPSPSPSYGTHESSHDGHSVQGSLTTKSSTPNVASSATKSASPSNNTSYPSQPRSSQDLVSLLMASQTSAVDTEMIEPEMPRFMDENPETAIFSNDRDMIAELNDHFRDTILLGYRKNLHLDKVDAHINEILELCGRLNFDSVKARLLDFAGQRQQNPSSRAHICDLDHNAEPATIFNAIVVSAGNAHDAKLQRIYGQMRLCKSVERKIREGYVPEYMEHLSGTQSPMLPGLYIDDIADKMCLGGSQDAKKRKRKQLRGEHRAGKQWIQLVKDLGRPGIVFVIVFAGQWERENARRIVKSFTDSWSSGISCYAFAQAWNDFQRDCLTHILLQLPSIRRLIEEIGDTALEDFCRQGRLSSEVMGRIQGCCGPQMSFVESESVSESDSESASGTENEDKR